MNPRITRIVALPVLTERERSQWYFQRYIQHLPAGGRSRCSTAPAYNRAGVEKVLGFCTPEEHRRFLRQCPIFERLPVEDGIILIKYCLRLDEEQERRFQSRIKDPMRRWKPSPTDLHSRSRWVDYSRAKDEMFVYTDIPEAPWHTVEADDKPSARLNRIVHPLSTHPVRGPSRGRHRHPAAPERRGTSARREASTYVPHHAATPTG